MDALQSWNWLDYVLAIIVVSAVLRGLVRGFTREVISLGATVAGLIMGLWFYGTVATVILPYVKHPSFANVIGFFAVFLFFLLVGAFFSHAVEGVIRLAHLTFVNRALGAGFGIIKGALMCSVLVLGMAAFSANPPPESIAQSQLAPHVIGVAQLAASLAPRTVRNGFRASYDRLKEMWAGKADSALRQEL